MLPIPIYPGDNEEPEVLPDAALPQATPPSDTPTQSKLPAVPTRHSRARTRATGNAIVYGEVLRPWMCAYAEWLILETAEAPTRLERRMKANSLARASLTDRHLKALHGRPDFQEYCGELQRGPLEAARAKFRSRFPEYVDAHYEALQLARADGDHRGVAQIAEAALERIMPKKAEVAAATQVNITLSPEQVAGFASEYVVPTISAEVVHVNTDTAQTPED